MQINQVQLYTCQYANTFFITVAAVDITQAKSLFEQWLVEHRAWPKEQPVVHAKMHVKRQTTTRNVYVYG